MGIHGTAMGSIVMNKKKGNRNTRALRRNEAVLTASGDLTKLPKRYVSDTCMNKILRWCMPMYFLIFMVHACRRPRS
jgi:hypothetical protein